MTRPRPHALRSTAAALFLAAAALGLLAPSVPGSAVAAVGDGVVALRTALSDYLAGLPAPTNQAERRTVTRLEKAIAALSGDPADVSAEAVTLAGLYADLPAKLLRDPAIGAAFDAALAAIGPELGRVLDEIETELAAYPFPGPPAVAAVRDLLLRAREKATRANDPGETPAKRFRALAQAAGRLLDVVEASGALSVSEAECGTPLAFDTEAIADFEASIDGGPTITGTSMLHGGRGTRRNAMYSATVYGIDGNVRFVVRGRPIEAGPIPIDPDTEGTGNVFVTFQDRSVEYLADAGTFRITSIELKRYPDISPATQRYLRVTGEFDVSGAKRDGSPGPRRSMKGTFRICELRFTPE